MQTAEIQQSSLYQSRKIKEKKVKKKQKPVFGYNLQFLLKI